MNGRHLTAAAVLTVAPVAGVAAAHAEPSGCTFGHKNALLVTTIKAVCRGRIAGGPTEFRLSVDSGLGYTETSDWKPIGSTASVTVYGGVHAYEVGKRP